MAISTATVTIPDLSDYVGDDYNAANTSITVTNNAEGGSIFDTDTGNLFQGGGVVSIVDNAASITVPVPGDSNPASWQTEIHLHYRDPHTNKRTTRTFGPFTITESANLADLVEEQEVPPAYLTTVTAALDEKVDAAEAARDEAQAAAAAAVDISNIAVDDDIVDVLVRNAGGAGPKTNAAVLEVGARQLRGAVVAALTEAGSGSANAAALQAAVDTGVDVMIPAGAFDIAGAIDVETDGQRIFGVARDLTRLHQSSKPSRMFNVSAENVTISDMTFVGDGLDMSGTTKYAYQNYCGVRFHPTANGGRALRLRSEDMYICVRFGGEHNSAGLTEFPMEGPAITGLLISDIEVVDAWSAVFGGRYENSVIENVRGTYKKAFASGVGAPDTGPPPHLIYTYSPEAHEDEDLYLVEEWCNKGNVVRDCVALGATGDDTANAYALKSELGLQASGLVAKDCPGLVDIQGTRDSVIEGVSLGDLYPLSGANASVSLKDSVRNRVRGKVIKASTSDGRAVFTQSTALDNEVRMDVTANHAADDLTAGRTDVRIAGYRNTFEGAVRNIGPGAWYSGIFTVATGGQAVIRPDGSGGKYQRTIRCDLSHVGATIEYDPAKILPDGTVSGAVAISKSTGAIVRETNKRAGQTEPAGTADTWLGRLSGQPLGLTDDLKVWTSVAVSGGGTAVLDDDGLHYNGVTGAVLRWVDVGTVNFTATLTIGAAGAKTDGLLVAFDDSDNYVAVIQQISSGQLEWVIRTRTAGSNANVTTNRNTIASADGDVLVVTRTGTSLAITVNGNPLYSADPTVALLGTLTKAGLRMGAAGAGNNGATFESLSIVPA